MKKAQIQLGETISVLIVFFIILAFGLIFYARLQQGSVERQREENAVLKAIEITQRASFLSELQCSSNNVPVHNCIDIHKLQSFHTNIATQSEYKILYYDMLYYSNITVQKIFPSSATYEIYVNDEINWTKRINTKIPVTLYDSTAELAQQYHFGVLDVDVFI